MTGLFNLTTKKQKKLHRFFSVVVIFSLFLQLGSGIFYARPVLAEDVVEPTPVVEQPVETPQDQPAEVPQDQTPTETPAEVITTPESNPTPEVSPSPEPTPIIETPVEATPTPVEEVTPTPEPTENNVPQENTAPPQETGPPLDLEKPVEDPTSGQIAPTPTPTPTPVPVCLAEGQEIKETTSEDWNINLEEGWSQTEEPVKLGVKYVYPQENKVTVTFKCLPQEGTTSLKIQKVKISDLKLPEGTNPYGEWAYDITTGMQDGTFEYDVTLPKPEGQTAEVSFMEDRNGELKAVDEGKLNQEGDKVKANLDHFTILIVTTSGNGPVLSTALVNNQTQVTVVPNESITATIKVTTYGSGNSDDWKSSEYRIGNGNWICVDTPDYTSDITNQEASFSFNAPSSVGTYDVSFRAYNLANCNDYGSGNPSSTVTLSNAIIVQSVQPVANPSLNESCGIDVALVIDTSTSIDDGELATMKTAFNGFVNAFVGTPTRMAIVSFDDSAVIRSGFTSDLSSLNTVINGINGDGYTNWEDALLDTRNLFPDRADKPDLIVFTSDGNPTASSAGGNDLSQPNAHLAPAITQANAAKAAGIRIITLGIGADVSATRLQQISSADAYYNAADFAALQATLLDLVTDLCGGTITARKFVDQTPAQGWTFTINGNQYTTDINGYTPSVPVNSGTYSVTETLQSGYTFTSASCTGATNNGSQNQSNHSVESIVVDDNDVVACTFTNTELPTLTVNKVLNPVGHGGFDLKIDGTTYAHNVGNGGTTGPQTVSIGSHTVSEAAGNPSTVMADYAVVYGGDCNADGTITLAAGENKTCTITNTAYGSVLITKDVVPNDSSEWDFTLSGEGETYNANDLGDNESALFLYLLPGSYELTEISNPNYATDIVCNGVAGYPGSNGYLIGLSAGQNVSCTITNTLKTGTITIIKDSVNNSEDNFYFDSDLPSGDFELEDDGNPGNGGTPEQRTFTALAGSYWVNERDETGWKLTNIVCDGDDNINIDLTDGKVEFDLDAGENVTCTYTNNEIGSISGYKWDDENGNGLRDWHWIIWPIWWEYTESKLSGWTITLDKDVDGSIEDSTTTDGNGNYSFGGLVAGTYEICEVQQSGWQVTYPSGDVCQIVNLGFGEDKDHVKFGNQEVTSGSLTVCKYNDEDGNGTGDSPLHWNITIVDQDGPDAGETWYTATSGETGCITLEGMDFGAYLISEEQVAGWEQTYPLDNGNWGDQWLEINLETLNPSTDFYNHEIPYGSFAGKKYIDYNDDGQYNNADGDTLYEGWTIKLYKHDGTNYVYLTETTTDSNGEYLFENLEAGMYKIAEDINSSYVVTDPNEFGHYNAVLLQPGEDLTGFDFGNFEKGDLYVDKYEDLDGVLGRNADFESFISDPTFTFRVYEATAGGWLLKGQEDTDSIEGRATFTDVFDSVGSYFVCEVRKDGWEDMRSLHNPDNNLSGATDEYPTCEGITVSVSGYGVYAEFGNIRYGSISGMKFEDVDGNGVKDVGDNGLEDWMILLRQEETIIETTTTDVDGLYSFASVLSGEYEVCEVEQTGWTRTQPSDAQCWPVTVNPGQDLEGVDFGNFENGQITACKYDDYNGDGIKDENEPGIMGVAMTLEKKVCIYPDNGLDGITRFLISDGICQEGWEEVLTQDTREEGCYTFDNLGPGEYRVKEDLTDDDLAGYFPTDSWTTDGDYRVSDEKIMTSNANFAVDYFNDINPVELSLEKTSDKIDLTASRGDTVNFTLTVTNNADSTAYGVSVRDVLPTGFDYDEGTTSGTGWTISEPTQSGQQLTWNVGNIPAGESRIITYKVTISSGQANGCYPDVAVASGTNRANDPDMTTTYSNFAFVYSCVGVGTSYSVSVGGGFVLGAATTAGEVLGAATGSPTILLIMAILMILAGLTILLLKKGKKLHV